jgi:DNA-binding response OmpR family regulator
MKVLVVEDCPLTGEILQDRFAVLGQVMLASTGEDAVRLLAREHFDLVLVDLNLERRLAGFDVIERACNEGAYVVVLSGLEDAEFVSRAYEMGCRDYFVKGSDERTVPQIVEAFRAARHQERRGGFWF